MTEISATSPIQIREAGLPGESFGASARRTGAYGVLPTDNDTVVLEKLATYLLEENPGFQSTIPGPAGPTFLTLATFKAAPISNQKQALKVTGIPAGDFYWETANAPYTADDVNVIKADSTALSVGAWVRQKATAVAYGDRSVGSKLDEVLSVYDTQYAGGAEGDGSTNDAAAIRAAALDALDRGRVAFEARGVFAASNLKFPTGGDISGAAQLWMSGHPVFVQAVPNEPILVIDDALSDFLQSTGHRFECTVIPHPDSDKDDPNNIAVNLTGFSAANITVCLGEASGHTDTTGRFNTVVYADAVAPFAYGNSIRVIANAVPAPQFVVRFGNGGAGTGANPNINKILGWFNALDTVEGDTLIDAGDSTQTIIEGPLLIEACPDAIGIKAGNFTTIRDVWMENVGIALDFTGTDDTVANNCRVERVQFSGPGHVVKIHTALEAPPTFDHCLGDAAVTYQNQSGSSYTIPRIVTRSYAPATAPTVSFVQNGSIIPDSTSTRLGMDHHGRCTYQIRFFANPANTTDFAQLRIDPAEGNEIETATVGGYDTVTIGDTPTFIHGSLGNDAEGRDYNWKWPTTNEHAINVRVTTRALA